MGQAPQILPVGGRLFAYPGNCLNLTDYGVMNELALAYEATSWDFGSGRNTNACEFSSA